MSKSLVYEMDLVTRFCLCIFIFSCESLHGFEVEGIMLPYSFGDYKDLCIPLLVHVVQSFGFDLIDSAILLSSALFCVLLLL
jgi:hypothetical protein